MFPHAVQGLYTFMSPDFRVAYPEHLPARLCRKERHLCFLFTLSSQATTSADNGWHSIRQRFTCATSLADVRP